MPVASHNKQRLSPTPCSKCGSPVRIYETELPRLPGEARGALEHVRVCTNRDCGTNGSRRSRRLSDQP